MADAGWGSGEGAGPEPALNQWGHQASTGGGAEDRSAEGAKIEAPRGLCIRTGVPLPN